jgi:hypothetical protein
VLITFVPTPRTSATHVIDHVIRHVSPTPTPSSAESSVWTMDVPTWITAIATVGLFVGAIFTAIYAIKAFRKQSQEVTDQAEMLKIQSDQLGEQRKINERQVAVLELQHRELEASLKQRVADATAARSSQASKIYVWIENREAGNRIVSVGRDFYVSGEQMEQISADPSLAVYLYNTSSQPIYDVVIRTDHGADRHLPLLLPGSFVVFYKPPEATWAVSDFRDSNFVLWSRGGSGQLVDRGEKSAEATGEVFDVPTSAG